MGRWDCGGEVDGESVEMEGNVEVEKLRDSIRTFLTILTRSNGSRDLLIQRLEVEFRRCVEEDDFVPRGGGEGEEDGDCGGHF